MTDDEGGPVGEPETDGGVADADVYASESEGREYRETVYDEVDYDTLEEVPATGDYPKTDGESDFRLVDLPKVPKVRHIVGPSAIMLGAALGSGESLFWPSLIAENGWVVYWAFWVGVLTQFFINTELQRWTLATGESIFGGYKRLNLLWPWFFLLAGFFHVGWPGWVAGASEVFAAWTGVVPRNEWWIIGVISMVLIWLSYQAGPVMYNIVENAQTLLMALAIVFAVVLVFIAGSIGQLASVPAGAVSFGTLPQDMDIAVFLGGLAYAGAGGYINLSQGVWAREKGYGMGTYQGRVKNPLRGSDPEEISEGFAFEPTDTNMRRWRGWWKIIQQEHFLTFVIGLLVVGTIMMTITAEFVPAGAEVTDDALAMWIDTVIPQLGGIVGGLLFAMLVIALFSTEYAIIEVFVRNSVDILYQNYGREAGWNVGRVFFWALTVFVAWGIAIILASEFIQGFGQPWLLLVIGAAIAGAMMWPYNALTIILNTTRLPEHTQPGWGRVVAMWWATGFFGYFTILLIGGVLNNPEFGLSFPAFQTSVNIVDSGVGGYVLWLVALAVQVYTMYRSARAKLDANGTVDDADEASGFLA
jgi:hypothetical protein